MANVLEVLGFAELDRLQELSDDLEGTLLCIAYAGKSGDLDYIRECQEYMREKYGRMVEALGDEIFTIPSLAESRLVRAIGSVVHAYDGLQGILFLRDNDYPEEHRRRIEEDAKDLLYENLILPEDMQEHEWQEVA